MSVQDTPLSPVSPLSPCPFPPASGGERGDAEPGGATVSPAGVSSTDTPLSPPLAGGKGQGDRGESKLLQRIAVIGLAATGLATARILAERGATVTVYDGKPEDKLDSARVVEAKAIPGIRLALGVAEPEWSATDLVVPSPGVPKWAAPIAGALERGIPVWSEIEVAYRLAKAPILAITGTNGKTTTTALVGAICREAGLNTWVAGNIAEDEGKRTPLIVAAVECPADGVIVAEISSFQLEHVHTFRPKVAAWLNLSVDHMDRYASMEEYAEAKAKIFAAQTGDDYAILNADDAMVMRFSDQVGNGKRGDFHMNSDPGDWGGFTSFGGTALLRNNKILCYCRHKDPIVILADVGELPLPGKHNIQNVMVATLMTLAIGIKPEDVRAGVLGFRGVAHRMEFVAEIDGVRYINNSMCTNPAAVEASLSAIETPLVAISGGIHKGGDLTPMYAALKQHARKVVLIGAAKQEIADGLRDAGMSPDDVSFAQTLPEAVDRAAALATGGDTVMLVPGCASFDMFSGFEERGAVFREAVRLSALVSSPLSPNPFPPASGGERGVREAGEASVFPTSPPPSETPLSPPLAGGKGLGDRGESKGDTGDRGAK